MNSEDPLGDLYSIETELQDVLTLNSCTTLLSELIKFILYRKQQLPYTFDRLKYLVTKRNSKESQESISASVDRQFKIAEDGLKTLELIFEKTKAELASTSSKQFISEVALLFGSTPMTPKQVYRIHLPQICFSHSARNHPERKHLIHVLQSVILSNNLCNMLRKPLNPTNMYLFIRKSSKCGGSSDSSNSISDWFIPKNRYEIPKIGQHFHIKFRHPSEILTCECNNFKIYSDNDEATPNGESMREEERDFAWYQACAIFKGFSDVYINGVSVADLWLR